MNAAGSPRGRPAPRLRAMDALRLVAALAVVAFHFTARDHVRWGVLPHEAFPAMSVLTRYGYAGVHLFFVISGFVILMSIWGRTVPQFVASRVSRLYPAFWVAVLLTATLRWWWPSFEARTPAQVLANLTMFHEPFGIPHVDGVYWTLWVEMQFYLLMLLLLRWGVTCRRVLWAAGTVPAACTTLALVSPEAGAAITFLGWASMFGAGMVLCVIYRDGHTKGRWALVAFNAGQAALVAAAQKAAAINVIATGGTVIPGLLAVVAVAAIGLVAIVTLVPAIRDLDWRILTTLGALTYPLYLTHEYVGWALIQSLHPTLGLWPTLIATVATCTSLAWALHRGVERPVQRRLRHSLERTLTPPIRARARATTARR